MPAIARMASAKEYFLLERKQREAADRRAPRKKFEFLDYMDFCERYADYVCEHEKFIDRTGLAAVERLENRMHREDKTLGEIVEDDERAAIAAAGR